MPPAARATSTSARHERPPVGGDHDIGRGRRDERPPARRRPPRRARPPRSRRRGRARSIESVHTCSYEVAARGDASRRARPRCRVARAAPPGCAGPRSGSRAAPPSSTGRRRRRGGARCGAGSRWPAVTDIGSPRSRTRCRPLAVPDHLGGRRVQAEAVQAVGVAVRPAARDREQVAGRGAREPDGLGEHVVGIEQRAGDRHELRQPRPRPTAPAEDCRRASVAAGRGG